MKRFCMGSIWLVLASALAAGCGQSEQPKPGEELFMSTYAWFSTRVHGAVREYRNRNGEWPTTMTQTFGPGPWRTQVSGQCYLKEGDLRFELKSPPNGVQAVYEVQYPHYDAFKIEVNAFDLEMEAAAEGVQAAVGLGVDSVWPSPRKSVD